MLVLHESQQELCVPRIMVLHPTMRRARTADTPSMRKRYTAIKYRMVDAIGGRTQQDIAESLGIGQSALSRLLNPNGSQLTVDFVLRFAEATGADPVFLLTGTHTPGASVIQPTNALPSGAEAPQTLNQEGGRMPFTAFEIGLHATIRVVAQKWHEPGLRAIKRFVDHIEEFGPQKSQLRSGGVRDE
jgi:transcriptional regulator with XRE-family HTH domain